MNHWALSTWKHEHLGKTYKNDFKMLFTSFFAHKISKGGINPRGRSSNNVVIWRWRTASFPVAWWNICYLKPTVVPTFFSCRRVVIIFIFWRFLHFLSNNKTACKFSRKWNKHKYTHTHPASTWWITHEILWFTVSYILRASWALPRKISTQERGWKKYGGFRKPDFP